MINLPASAAAITIAAVLALLGVAPDADESGAPRIFNVGVSLQVKPEGGLNARLYLPAAVAEYGGDPSQPATSSR